MQTKYDIEFLEDATEKLKALAHPIRFVMVELLSKSSSLSVTEIHESLDIEQAVASHHLRILKNQDIVKVVRDGKNSNYSIAQPEYLDLVQSLIHIIRK
ncbi:MAG: metalloregulator ArsR/SmtB family transcription factor [Saprospiraceae bacterium]